MNNSDNEMGPFGRSFVGDFPTFGSLLLLLSTFFLSALFSLGNLIPFLILWPAVFIISLILGSGVEVYGNSYNMDENYLMLVGPLFLTLFFFGILFKMDKNARDGSLYAAEKQSYLEEMEKYLKARTAYLELVTLQAESKKQEIVEGGSEE